jgi:WD40 repeat protein
MSTTLLDFSVSTTPHPLHVATPGTITVVANNPGGYSDQPERDYVAVTHIIVDFGTKGSGGSELTTSDGASIQVTPPPGWGPPAVEGLRFMFTPPSTGKNIFPSAGLQFRFAKIPVNTTVGTVNLVLVENASSPGNPAQPDVYPPQPPLARKTSRPLGKFPQDFSVGDLIVQPPNVPAGGATTLSWSGSPGAIYEIGFGATRVAQHVNGTLLQPNDTFPNPAAGDTPLSLRNRTVFTLTVTYTPPGGGNPAIFQRQASVSIFYPNPEIELFTATPPFIALGPSDPAIVTLSWNVKNGRKPDCVAFAVTPPLSVYPASGKDLKHTLAGSQAITLTAYGDEGTTPVSQVRDIVVARTVNISGGFGRMTNSVAVSPDGKYAIAGNNSSNSISIIDTSDPDFSKWKTVATRTGFPSDPESIAIASSAHGSFALVVAGVFGPARLAVLTMSGEPKNWPMSVRTDGLGAYTSVVAVTPDGLHAFVTCRGTHIAPTSQSCVSILSITGADPAGWPVFTLGSGDPQLMVTNICVAPRGDYAFITLQDNKTFGPDKLRVLALNGPDPAQWPVVTDLDAGCTSANGLAISPDGKLALLPDYKSNAVRVFDLSASDPARWRFTTSLNGPFDNPGRAAFSADGIHAFVTNYFESFVTVLGITPEAPATWPAFRLTHNVGPFPCAVTTAKAGSAAFIACDHRGDGGSVTVVSLGPSITSLQAPPPVPVLHLARDPASRF